jgi:FMN phosphatase YigB (HAD superfamily)
MEGETTMLNTVLFDLDGTLLPMDMKNFAKLYFESLADCMRDLNSPKELVSAVLASTEEMVQNIEYTTNEEVFMNDFTNRINGDLKLYNNRFDTFYDTEYFKAKEAVSENEFIKKAVNLLKEKGYKVIIATNPLFPLKAIEHRIRWAGFEPSDFEYISHFEKNHYCKPQIQFYEEVLKDIDKKPEECMMVGNDVQEDLVAGKLGVKTFLIKDCLIHRTSDKITADYQGNYQDFYELTKQLPHI